MASGLTADTSTTTTERDYTGVPTAELVALYEKHVDVDIVTFAERINMDERDLKKIVITQNYAFTGLGIADKILLGLGLDLSTLERHGEIHIVVRDSKNAALRLARELAEFEPDTTEAEIKARAERLLELRRSLCAPSEEQRDRLRRDSERSTARMSAKRIEQQSGISGIRSCE